MIFERLINNIENNYQRHLDGGFNFIPVGFKRFSKYVPGVVKSSYTIVTASSGVGKSKFTRFFYVSNVLDFVKNNPDINVVIIIFSLELSAEEYLADILCAFLKRDYNIDISYRELLSIHGEGEDVKVNSKIIEYLKSYQDYVDFFNKHVRIYTNIKNPYGMYKKCRDVIINTVKGREDVKLDEEGTEMKYWRYDDDNVFIEVIVDHISLTQPETNKSTNQTMTLHQAMSKFSSDYGLTLKNYYQAHLIVVQQQAADKERVEHDFSGKSIEAKLEPSLDGLGDNKLTARDATEVIGIFAPDRYEIKEHPKGGYNIEILKDTYRSVKLLKSRYSAPNLRIGMLFNGATGTFEELPKVEEFKTDRDYVKYLTKKGIIKDEKPVEVVNRIKLGTFKD